MDDITINDESRDVVEGSGGSVVPVLSIEEQQRLDLLQATRERVVERLRRDSQRLLRESIQLDDDVQRLQEEIRRMKLEAQSKREAAQEMSSEAEREQMLWHKHNFAVHCDKLRRNDPTATTCLPRDVTHHLFPIGYGSILGESLLGNTHVKDISLDIYRLWKTREETVDSMQALLEYSQSSNVLNNVHVYYDQQIRPSERDLQLVRALLDAVAKNQNVTSFNWEWMHHHHARSITPLHRFLRVAKQLKNVQLYEMDINRMTLDEQYQIISAFDDHHGTAKRMRLLGEFDGTTLCQECQMHFYEVGGGNNSEEALREYHINFATHVTQEQALTRILQSTNKLEHLKIERFHFDRIHAVRLIEGLRRRGSGPSCVTTKLTLRECKFAEEATQQLINFMQSPATFAESNNTTGSAYLHSLFIVGSVGKMVLGRTPVASMLALQPNAVDERPAINFGKREFLSTIGSKIQVLSLEAGNMANKFLKEWANNAEAIRISRLRLGGNARKSFVALSKALPKLLSLRELMLHQYEDWDDESRYNNNKVSLFLEGVRKNASLHRVTSHRDSYYGDDGFDDDDEEDGSECPFEEIESVSVFVKSCCERNQRLPVLLSVCALSDRTDGCIDEEPPSKRFKPSDLPIMSYQLPLLLSCANQIPSLQSTWILSGLMAHVDGIGPPL